MSFHNVSTVLRRVAIWFGLLSDVDHSVAPELKAEVLVEEPLRPAASVDVVMAGGETQGPAGSAVAATENRIDAVVPLAYSDAVAIGERPREGVSVAIDLSKLAKSEARHLIDFASGLVFGLHGSIERIANRVFLLCPPGVVVDAEHKERLRGQPNDRPS